MLEPTTSLVDRFRCVHHSRHELQRHIAAITVDGQGQMRIEGTLVGALDAVLKLVAGARYSLEYRVELRWTACVRLAA